MELKKNALSVYSIGNIRPLIGYGQEISVGDDEFLGEFRSVSALCLFLLALETEGMYAVSLHDGNNISGIISLNEDNISEIVKAWE